MTAGDHGSTIKQVGTEEKKQSNATLEFPHYKRVGNYLLGSRIGEGSFAKVYVGLHSPTGEKVAIKVINKEQAKHDGYVFRNLHREGKILQVLRHPNILQVFDILETCNNYYLITELCSGGDLIDIVAEKGPLSENVVRSYVWKVANAVAYMHERNVIHRDLKVENLLFDSDGNLKVIDFGLSNALPNPTDKKSLGFLSTQGGSPAYAAPELLSKRPYGPKVDVWSIGVITYALLVGKLPFTVEPFHVQKLCRKMLRSEMNPFPPNISHHCRHFIRTLLQPSTIKRPSINEVLKMKWFAFQPLELKRNSLKPSLIRRHSPCAQAKTTSHILTSSASTSNFLTTSRSMDVDTEVVREMTNQYDYDETSIQYCVQKNRPGPILTTYHLLLQRARNAPTTDRTMVSSAPIARKESVKKLDEERTRKLINEAATVISPRAFQPHIYDNYITKLDGSAPNQETCTANPEIQGRAAAFKTLTTGDETATGTRNDYARKPNPQSLLLNLPDQKHSDTRKFCLKPAADDEGMANQTHKSLVTPSAAKMLHPLQNISQLSKPPLPTSQMKSTTLPEIILPSKSSIASMRSSQQQQTEPDSINLLASLKLRPSQANKLKTKSKISESQLRLKPGTRDSTDNFTSPSAKSHKNSQQQQRMRKRSFTETIAATLSFLKSTTGSRNNSNNNRRT